MRPEPISPTELGRIAALLGSPIRAPEAVAWGDARATHRLSLADGRGFALRRFAGTGANARAERIGRLMSRLAQAGLPVPPPMVVEMPGGPWLLTPWVEGMTGASWLDDPDRARHLAERMGRLAGRLRTVEPDGEAFDERGADPLATDTSEQRVFVHGDFAPINVVMRDDGEIGALLDFEHAGTGPDLLDIAWWGWVVRHHHPEAWTAAWPTFLAAAGLDRDRIEARLHRLVLQTLQDRVAASDDADARRRWQDRLVTARAWTVRDGQAT
jgi:aminoglycoside phosphotransferase (APT) family kinase protein